MKNGAKPRSRISVIAVALVQRRDELLVFQQPIPVEGETFCRPLGGGTESGVRGNQALRRESHAEIGANSVDVHCAAAWDSLVAQRGEPRHEVVRAHNTGSGAKNVDAMDTFAVGEDQRALRKRWIPLENFERGRLPLPLDGLLPRLREGGAV